MCISDRVMGGNVYAVYDPCYNVDDDDEHHKVCFGSIMCFR